MYYICNIKIINKLLTMQRIDFISNAILIKSQKRFTKSQYANQHTLGKPFNDTDYIFEGLFRSNNDWVLSKDNEYFTVPMGTNKIQSNQSDPSQPKERRKIELIEISDLNYDD